jgi:hypothetical protein
VQRRQDRRRCRVVDHVAVAVERHQRAERAVAGAVADADDAQRVAIRIGGAGQDAGLRDGLGVLVVGEVVALDDVAVIAVTGRVGIEVLVVPAAAILDLELVLAARGCDLEVIREEGTGITDRGVDERARDVGIRDAQKEGLPRFRPLRPLPGPSVMASEPPVKYLLV